MNAYIVSGFRTAVGKAPKGGFRFTRPDDLAAHVIKHLVNQYPQLDPATIDDLIVGNAVPEAEQGMQMGRMISLLSLPIQVPGFIVNRYCGSGLEAIAIAAARIHAGQADCIIAGGTESMSMVPTVGWKTALNYNIAKEHSDYYIGMGLTAEMVQQKYGITREAQDQFALRSHTRALSAIASGKFTDEIVPVEVEEVFVEDNKRKTKKYTVSVDEGPRADTNLEALAKLKPVFAAKGTVTAGNSSQTSDGAAFVMLMSERKMKELGIEPRGRMLSYTAAGVEPSLMGIGPIAAIPKAVKIAGLSSADQIDLIELNEAFASQALAVVQTVGLDMEKVNVNGGAIALGHPLGCSGAKLTVQLFNELQRQNKKYGMVTACVGGGQGVAGIFERF